MAINHLTAALRDGLLTRQRLFALKVYQRGDCWEWRGRRDPRLGYGAFWDGTRMVPAHRYAYELAKGPVPPELDTDHLCRHPWCVRPSHLEAVSHKVNCLRGVGVATVNHAKTHCQNGHELSGENVRWEGSKRRCVQCKRDYDERRYDPRRLGVFRKSRHARA